jgi:GDP/UDP-N,N'-diacetylbacillosamine 2-epimerase (hydrolysing)
VLTPFEIANVIISLSSELTQISLASKIHFTSTELYKLRVVELIESDKNIFDIGALSISNIEEFKPINKKDFFSKFKIKDEPYCLITFHPETNAFRENKNYAIKMRKALEFTSTKINLVITMPNADNMGMVYREQLYLLKETMRDEILLIENFGKENYFSAMYYADFLLGNTSSGIIEAGSFRKYVVNVGDRQKGRAQSDNIINVPFDVLSIRFAVSVALEKGVFKGENIYFKKEVVENIIKIIKK